MGDSRRQAAHPIRLSGWPGRAGFARRARGGRRGARRRCVVHGRGDPGRPWPDASRLGRRRVPGLLVRRRRLVFGKGNPGPDRRDRALPVDARRAAEGARLGPPSGPHARDGRPTDASDAFCGQLRVDWHFCQAADPQAKGCVERLQDFMERSFDRVAVRQPARLSAPARRLVRAPREWGPAQDAALPAARPARRGARA